MRSSAARNRPGLASEETIAARVAAAALVEAASAARVIADTEEAVLSAPNAGEAATRAGRAVEAAVQATAVVVADAAAAAVEARRIQAVLVHDVLHDELTGLPNRRLLLDRLHQSLARTRRAQRCVAVLLLDLDNFKSINDSLGHAAGDELLIMVARRLRERLRREDTCARMSGDEFVVVCDDLRHPDDSSLVASRLEAALAEGIPLGDHVVAVLASIGVAVSSVDSSALELLKEADAAMYRVKGRAIDRFADK